MTNYGTIATNYNTGPVPARDVLTLVMSVPAGLRGLKASSDAVSKMERVGTPKF